MIKQTYAQYLDQLEEFYPTVVLVRFGPAFMRWYKDGLNLPQTIAAMSCLRKNGATIELIEYEVPDQAFGDLIRNLKPSDFPDSLIS